MRCATHAASESIITNAPVARSLASDILINSFGDVMLNWLQPKTQLEMNTASTSRCERLGGIGDRALSEPVLMWEIHIYKMVQFQTDQRNDWCAKKEKNRKIVRCPYLQATSAWPIQYSRKKATAKSKKNDYERDAEIGIKQQRRWRRWQQMKRTQINRTQKKTWEKK